MAANTTKNTNNNTMILRWHSVKAMINSSTKRVFVNGKETDITLFVNPLSSFDYDIATDTLVETTEYEMQNWPEENQLKQLGLNFETWHMIAEAIMSKLCVGSVAAYA